MSKRLLCLSPAELEAMEQMCRGLRDKEIARLLGKSHVTIELQIRSAKKKLGAETRAHAVALLLYPDWFKKSAPP